jgi:hypothetical protein
LRKIREAAVEELVRALHAGARPQTLKPIATLIVQCDARLEKLTDRRLEADEPSVEKRQRIFGESLEPASDARGPRRCAVVGAPDDEPRRGPETPRGALTDC